MTIREEFGLFLKELTGRQKAVVVGVIALVLILMVAAFVDSAMSLSKARQFEREAEKAHRDAGQALERASKIAAEIKVREKALDQVKEKRDAKQMELDKAAKDTFDARADYDRAVREQRPGTPSTEQLCGELAQLGYPCG